MAHGIPSKSKPAKGQRRFHKYAREIMGQGRDGALAWGLDIEETWKAIYGRRDRLPGLIGVPQGTSAEDGLWAVAVAQRLPELRKQLPVDEWASVVRSLLQMATEALQASAMPDSWIGLLFCVELGLTLHYHCPEFPECVSVGEASYLAAIDLMKSDCSATGTPHGVPPSRLIPFFGAWTRSLVLCRAIRGSLPTELRERYEYLLRYFLCHVRHDRTVVYQAGATAMRRRPWRDMLRVARHLVSDPTDRNLIDTVGLQRVRCSKKITALRSAYDEVQGVAVLSQGWKRSDLSLHVDHRKSPTQIELQAFGETLLLGDLQPEVSLNGERLEFMDSWSLQCWYSEPEADYLEVEWELSQGCRIQRQFLLAKEDSFAFFADTILPNKPGKIEYAGVWPLANGLSYRPRAETTDGQIMHGETPIAQVIPLPLAEWRSERSIGAISSTNEGPRMKLEAEGQALYAPMLWYLRTKDRSCEPTWRHLTVAESLHRVDRDIAVGYRFQCGPRQWLIYKSLSRFGNRTVMGQNYAIDFACNRFLSDGMTKTIVDVEVDTDDDGPDKPTYSPDQLGTHSASDRGSSPTNGTQSG